MRRKILKYPYYLISFPVFFVLHGFTENYYYVSVKSALLLTTIYITGAAVLAAFFYLLFKKHIRKAGVMTAFTLSFYFFFGNIYDLLIQYFQNTFIVKYGFLISVFLLLSLALFLLLKRKKELVALTSYLNVLFLLLVLIDVFTLSARMINSPKSDEVKLSPGYTYCPDCPKPDIYIIMLDGYAGPDQLKDQFHFDNKNFTDTLINRGFKVISKSYSNYNYTPFSTGSTLNMEYLDSSKSLDLRRKGNRYAADKINQNKLVSFLRNHGYTFYNHSIFKVAGQAAPTGGSFVPANAKLINGNTFFSRFEKDVLMNIAGKANIKWYLKKGLYATDKDNQKLIEMTLKTAATKTMAPKIVYTHLLMPHHPYYYDEKGVARPFETLYNMSLNDSAAYLSYLKYTNWKMTGLIDHILSTSGKPPVIVLLGDHGYRHYESRSGSSRYLFSTLQSIHLPEQNHQLFPDTLSNVNFFRVMLNSIFRQELPLLEDRNYIIDF